MKLSWLDREIWDSITFESEALSYALKLTIVLEVKEWKLHHCREKYTKYGNTKLVNFFNVEKEPRFQHWEPAFCAFSVNAFSLSEFGFCYISSRCSCFSEERSCLLCSAKVCWSMSTPNFKRHTISFAKTKVHIYRTSKVCQIRDKQQPIVMCDISYHLSLSMSCSSSNILIVSSCTCHAYAGLRISQLFHLKYDMFWSWCPDITWLQMSFVVCLFVIIGNL